MATYVGAGTPGTTSAGAPAGVAVGDYVGVFAYRNAATAPTLPAGWTQCIKNDTNPASIAAFREWDGVWTMPTFTNANRCVSFAVRAASGKEIGIGYADDTARNNSNIVWPTMALHVTDGSSVIVRGVAHTRPDSTIPTPTNHTLIDANGTQPGYGTFRKNSSTDGNTVTVTISRSTTMTMPQVEYKDVTPVAVTQAAYQFFDEGAETTAVSLAPQNTSYIANVALGDVEVGLRMRLQNAGGGAPTLATDDWQLQYSQERGGVALTTGSQSSLTIAYDNLANRDAAVAVNGNGYMAAKLFTGNGRYLRKLGFALTKNASPTGLLTAELRTADRLTVLATSTSSVDVSTLAANPTYSFIEFDFASYLLANGTQYAMVVVAPATGFTTVNNFSIGGDASSPPAPNVSSFYNGAWGTIGQEFLTRVYTLDTYVNVTAASTVVRGYACPNTVDGGATTNRLTGGTGTFVAGKVSEDGLLDDLGWTGNNYTEALYELIILAADVASQDILTFRVLRNGVTSEMTYTQTPTLEITVGSVQREATISTLFTFSATAVVHMDVQAAISSTFTFTATAIAGPPIAQLFFGGPFANPQISAGLHRATNSTKLNGVAQGWNVIGASPYRTATGSQATLQPSPVAGPTNGIEAIQSGNPVEWISPPLDRNVTISGTISAQLWHGASAGTNAAINVIIERLDSKMLVVSTVGRSNNTTAAGTTDTKQNMSFTPTSTNMLKGDRFRIRAFFDDAPTMAVGGGILSFQVGALVEDAVGDCWIKFTELFSFQSTTPAGTVLYLTDTQSDMDAGVKLEKVMWTDRGTVSTAGTYAIPATAWDIPQQFRVGGAFLEWYSKPLAGFTLDGLIELNMRISGTGSNDFGVRAELDIVDQQNFLMTNWAAGSMINSTAPIGFVAPSSDSSGGNPITQTQWKSWLSGPTFVVDPQWRIRLKLFVSNQSVQQQFTGTTASLHYNGPTPGASGDAWIQLPQVVSEFSTGPATREATIATTFLFTGTATAVRTLPASITASYTFTATAAAGPLPRQSLSVVAAHVWNISPIQGRRPMNGQATAAHLWTIAPITGRRPMKGQSTASHVWNVTPATGKRTMNGQATASHVWNTAPATGVMPVLGVKQGSATASWTETLTATGRRPMKGSATAAWLGRVGYLVDDDFNGPDQTVILDLGYIPIADSTLYLDGKGNAIASGYGGVTHPKAVLNNSWMEIAFRLADVSSYVIVMLFRMPTASTANGTGTGYAVTINELGIGIDRLGVRKTSVSPTMVTTKDYVMRVEWTGGTIRVFRDSTEILNWPDSIPLVGNYVGLYLDNNYGPSDQIRYLYAGNAAVGQSPGGAGTATASHVWNVAPSQGRKPQKGQATASHLWTIGPVTGKRITLTAQVTATHLWTITPATGVTPILGAKQGVAIASWTETVAPAVGKRITRTLSVVAAHDWTIAPATGRRTMKGQATATHTWTIAPAQGKRVMQSQVTSVHIWTIAPATGKRITKTTQVTAAHLWTIAPSTGVMPIVGVKQGTAVARHDWTVTPATGKKNPIGQATAAHVWTVAPATGKRIMKGQATATHLWTIGPITGKRIMNSAQVTAAHLWTVGPVTGKRFMRGQATSTHTWNVFPATGFFPIVGVKQGTALARHDWTITIVGKRVMQARADAVHVWTLIATGKRIMKGQATASHLWTIAPATGTKPLRGQATAAHTWTIVAQGLKPTVGAKQGTGIANHTWTVGPATGTRTLRGQATAAHLWTVGPITGRRPMRGQATASHLWTVGPVTGKRVMRGSAAATHLWSVSPSTGRKQPVGLATAVHVWRPTAEGLRFTRGSAVAVWKFNVASALGSPGIVGVVQGVWDGFPVVGMQYGDKPIFECLMVEP